MDTFEKAIRKLASEDKKLIRETVNKIIGHSFQGLDVQKLKGTWDVFRARKGDFRILYRFRDDGEAVILAIERRSEKTYRRY
mgnify:CR=1 FL=1